jgi:hypothetical protein
MRGWRVVSVESLPPPHWLWKQACPLRPEYEQIVAETPEGPDRYRRAFERFLAECGERMHECEYHEPDWSLIAGIAVEAVESGADDPLEEAERLAAAHGLSDEWIEWLGWLLLDPVFTIDRGRKLGNGLHRVCAMKAVGVKRCPISEDPAGS